MIIKTINFFAALFSNLLFVTPRAAFANGNNPPGDASFELPPGQGGWILSEESTLSMTASTEAGS